MHGSPDEEPQKVKAADDGAFPVERYAEVLAYTVYFGVASRREILRLLGVEEAAWAASDAKWMQALVDEALQDEHPVAAAFTAGFAPVHKRLKAEKPAIETIGTLLAGPSASPQDATAAGAVVHERPPTVQTGIPDVPAPQMPAAPPTYLAPSRNPLAGTSLALDVSLGPALPFSGSAEEKLAPPAARPPIHRAPAHLAATMNVTELPLGPALPFAKSTGETPAPPVALPPVHRAPAQLSGTMSTLDLPLAPALPFETASTALPDLSLEEYALLRANLTVKGEEDPETWRQFGITSPAAKKALQARFAARFREDPDAQARFVELVRKTVSDLRAQA